VYIYRLAYAQVFTSEGFTDPIKIMKGVLQGETASPALFNLFIEGIVAELEESNIHGFRLQTIIIHILLYADDMCIVAATRETLQLKINVAARFLANRGLQVNLNKTKVIVFKRSGRISKYDVFTWNGSKVETVKNYTYLGVTFSSSGSFEVAATEFVRKGKMAQGASLSTFKQTKVFNIDVASKLFDSIIKSTTLYAAGIWDLQHSNKLECVQQQFYKRILNLLSCTPNYFIRLETGRPHLSLEVMKLSLLMYQRILNSPTNSLLRESYYSLRRISNLYPYTKYSWCLQLRAVFVNLNFNNVWIKDSANFLCLHREPILEKLRQELGVGDMELARQSRSIPHLPNIVNGAKTEAYLHRNLPSYLVTCIAQVRLNYSIIFNKGTWYNFGMFDNRMCTSCGELDSFSHLLHCSSNRDLKAKYLPNCDDLIGLVSARFRIKDCSNIYYFISSALKRKYNL